MQEFKAADNDIGTAEGDYQKQSCEATGAVSEEDRTGGLECSEVELATAVNAIHGNIKPIVSAQKIVTTPEISDVAEVRKFQIVAADRIAEVPQSEVTTGGDTVEGVVNKFVGGYLFGDVGGHELHIGKRLLHHRTQPLAELDF